MKSRNIFSREDVLKINDNMIRSRIAQSSQTNQTNSKQQNAGLSIAEINRAFAAAKKTLAEV